MSVLLIIAIERAGDIIKATPGRLSPNFLNENLSKIQLLLDSGVDINQTIRSYRSLTTPFIFTVKDGYIEIADFFIKQGADVNKITSMMKWSPLYYAVEKGNFEMVKLLIVAGAKVNIRDRCRRTPLNYAIKSYHTEIIDLLKKKMEEEQLFEQIRSDKTLRIAYETQIKSLIVKLAQLPLNEQIIKAVNGDFKLVRVE